MYLLVNQNSRDDKKQQQHNIHHDSNDKKRFIQQSTSQSLPRMIFNCENMAKEQM